jgi:hypothetical protein
MDPPSKAARVRKARTANRRAATLLPSVPAARTGDAGALASGVASEGVSVEASGACTAVVPPGAA